MCECILFFIINGQLFSDKRETLQKNTVRFILVQVRTLLFQSRKSSELSESNCWILHNSEKIA